MLSGCGEEGGGGGAAFKTTLALKNSSGGVSTVFNSAEPVTMELSVTNLKDSPQTITMGSTNTSEFVVAREGETGAIWYSSYGKGFLGVIVKWELVAGETITNSVTWDQTDIIANATVGLGNYVAQGFLHTTPGVHDTSISAEAETRSAPVSFTIK